MEVPALLLLITVNLFIHNAVARFHKSVDAKTVERNLSITNESVIKNNRINFVVIGGGGFTEILRVPFQAQICKGYLVHCGAVIISKNWLITAAHCIQNQNISELKVITGSQYPCYHGPTNEIDKFIVHSEYDSNTLNNDICLIKLRRSIRVIKIQEPIKIANEEPQTGDMMLISGYGNEEGNQGRSSILKIARVPVLDPRKCSRLYQNTGDKLPDSSFCAGGSVDSACSGDSGGPGVVNDRLVGIISAGRDCGSSDFPSIFTRVVFFRDWIQQHTDIQLQ